MNDNMLHNPQDYWRKEDYDEDEVMVGGCFTVVCYIAAFLVGLIICILLCGCTTTQYVPVVEHHTDTVRVNHTERDSIYIHDSTYIKEKGDTVLIEKWHTRWRDRWQHDTIYKSRVDSVPAPYPVEIIKEVKAKPNSIDSFIRSVGFVTICAGIVWFLVWGYRIFRRLGM